jgi:AAA family ATP:ADP antiporter
MKISDRGLSYSISRASKELLYIPVDPVIIYQAKAWIDMFGYRIFKVLGSLLIIGLTQWSTFARDYFGLGWVVISGCLIWAVVLVAVHREYRSVSMISSPVRAGLE